MRRFLVNSAIVLISLAVSLGVVEVAVRMFSPEPIRPRFTVDLGYGVRGNEPDMEVVYFVPDQYEATYRTNSVGMRGTRNYETRKPDDVCRIAIIGDSFAFGEGVADEEVISAVLADLLNEDSAGNPFEVLNFGVPGFGTAEELVLYQNHARNYAPDIVAILYFNNDTGNSMVSNLFEINGGGKLERAAESYLPGVETREAMDANPVLRWLSTNSQAWNLIRNRLSAYIHEQRLAGKGLASYQTDDPEAARLTREILIEFADVTRSDNAVLVVFAIPNHDMTSNFPLSPTEFSALGATFVDGREVLEADDYYVFDGHWNRDGHAKAAIAIADALRPSLRNADGACRLD